MRKFTLGIVVLTAAALLVLTAPAMASDYFHECRTADGNFIMNDEALYAANSKSKEIPYTILSRTTLSHSKGYCLSKASPDKSRHFWHEHKKYVLRIRFRHQGQQFTEDAICELATDGLPAAYSCDQRVVVQGAGQKSGSSSSSSSSPGSSASAGGVTRWNHNGSIMRLEADGALRRFVYVSPRRGMQRVGVRSGTLLFDGRREGRSYEGTARIFNKRCGAFTYPVRGEISDDERRVTLWGRAPRVGSDCNVRGSRDDRLVFDLLPSSVRR